MDLRNGNRVVAPQQQQQRQQQQQLQFSPAAKAGFEEGVGLIFSQWTALILAVENQWGGSDSETKANYLIEDILDWFYKKKEHYADDLEMELTDTLLEDFHVEAEDGSPAQVAQSLIELYQACLRGDASLLQHLRQRQASGAAASKKQLVGLDGAEVGGDEGSSSSDGEGDSMDQDMADAATPAAALLRQQQQQPPQGAVVDADGFELVQKRRGRR